MRTRIDICRGGGEKVAEMGRKLTTVFNLLFLILNMLVIY